MKKIIITLALFVLSSQFAMAAETGRFYVGAGIAELTNKGGISVSLYEESFLSNPDYNSHRNENRKRLNGNIFLGYKLANHVSLEIGYIGGGKDFTSETTGAITYEQPPTVTPSTSDKMVIPFSVKQTEKVSAWHASFVGAYPLNDSIKLLGRIGIMKSKTDWEQRISYGCPSNMSCDRDQYQGWSTSSSRTAPLFGLGVDVKVTDNLSLRAEMLRSSALKETVPTVDLIFNF